MTKAGEVARELRRLADAFDKHAEVEIESPMVSFHCNSYSAPDKGKSAFVTLARILPRPLDKDMGNTQYELKYSNDSIWVRAVIDRSHICEIIEPAKPAVYHCPSLLSEEEEAALGDF